MDKFKNNINKLFIILIISCFCFTSFTYKVAAEEVYPLPPTTDTLALKNLLYRWSKWHANYILDGYKFTTNTADDYVSGFQTSSLVTHTINQLNYEITSLTSQTVNWVSSQNLMLRLNGSNLQTQFTGSDWASGDVGLHIGMQLIWFESKNLTPHNIKNITGFNSNGDIYNIYTWEWDGEYLYIYYLLPASETNTTSTANGAKDMSKYFIIEPEYENRTTQFKKRQTRNTTYQYDYTYIPVVANGYVPDFEQLFYSIQLSRQLNQLIINTRNSGSGGSSTPADLTTLENQLRMLNTSIDSIKTNLANLLQNNLIYQEHYSLDNYLTNSSYISRTVDSVGSKPRHFIYKLRPDGTYNGGLFLLKTDSYDLANTMLKNVDFRFRSDSGDWRNTAFINLEPSGSLILFTANQLNSSTNYYFDIAYNGSGTGLSDTYAYAKLYYIPIGSEIYTYYFNLLQNQMIINSLSNLNINGDTIINVDFDQTIINESSNDIKVNIDDLINLTLGYNNNIDLNNKFNSVNGNSEYKQFIDTSFQIFDYDINYPSTSKLSTLWVGLCICLIIGVIL
ncbi:MAG: hypothetical protein MJ232_04610 [archaeon]|nr:hypothetical protein [archaeon]